METEIKVGTYVRPENWMCGNLLEEGLPGFCDFYLPTNNGGPIKHVAVNVKVTGRKAIRREGTWLRRVEITFVGDGRLSRGWGREPSVKSGGWIQFYDN